ncbi:MAG: HAD family hydrolase [Sedimentisphaerales bacterium]|nr:HAD family hydrolase [Sedimentisphaerales bacterium]
MSHVAKPLIELKPQHDFFIGIDSDGCVFDTMGIKQRECFCPLMVGYFHLQPVALAARECKEFADLFSKTRGANRHKTAVRILTELLPSHPMVRQLDFKVPDFSYYIEWVNNPNSLLSNEGLKHAIDTATDVKAKSQLRHVLKWSERVNELIAEIVKGIPPFPHVRPCLEKIAKQADMIICSATPQEALEREWQEHGLADYPRVIAGQEMGKKAEHLQYATQGHYEPNCVLMIGDAPGDMKAARANNALFYPINPGNEDTSWRRLHDEALDKFIHGEYAGAYEQKMIEEFETYLPEHPPWNKPS